MCSFSCQYTLSLTTSWAQCSKLKINILLIWIGWLHHGAVQKKNTNIQPIPYIPCNKQPYSHDTNILVNGQHMNHQYLLPLTLSHYIGILVNGKTYTIICTYTFIYIYTYTEGQPFPMSANVGPFPHACNTISKISQRQKNFTLHSSRSRSEPR